MNTNELKIANLLKDLGIPANLRGYSYLKCALELTTSDMSYTHSITKRLYPDVAKQLDSTPNRVERAIRHAIHVFSLRGNLEFCNKLFRYSISTDRGKPTNGEFIATLAEYLILTQEEKDVN